MCAVSGRRLLRDEVARSDVSGKVVDDALLVSSSASGRRALAEEMVVCAATGVRLLPDESGTCAITGKRVDLRMMVRSDVSGRVATGALMVRCAKSGSTVLPSELVQCAVSDERVLQSLTEECAVTKRRAIPEHLRTCPVSGKRYIDDQVTRQEIARKTAQDQILRASVWAGRPCLVTELRKCRLCGLAFEPSELNSQHEFGLLRILLDGGEVQGATKLDAPTVQWLKAQGPATASVQDVTCVRSPDGKRVFGAARAKTGLLGMHSLHLAVGIMVQNGPRLMFTPIVGRRTASGWTKQDV